MRPFYRRTADIPEMTPLTKAERTEVWVASSGAIFREPMTYLVLLGCFICYMLLWSLGRSLAPGYFGIFLGVIFGNAIAYTLFWYYSAEKIRPHLAKTILNRKLG